MTTLANTDSSGEKRKRGVRTIALSDYGAVRLDSHGCAIIPFNFLPTMLDTMPEDWSALTIPYMPYFDNNKSQRDEEVNVVVTPGAGFGAAGEGFFRISAFNSRENVQTVCERLKAIVS